MTIDITFSPTDPDREINRKYYDLVIREQKLKDELIRTKSGKMLTKLKLKRKIRSVGMEIRNFNWHKGVYVNSCIMDENGILL